jgi:hypothetical protein
MQGENASGSDFFAAKLQKRAKCYIGKMANGVLKHAMLLNGLEKFRKLNVNNI